MTKGNPNPGSAEWLSSWLAEPGKFTGGGDCWRFTPEFDISELQAHAGNACMVLQTPLGRVAFETITDIEGERATWRAAGHIVAFASTERQAPVELIYTRISRSEKVGYIKLTNNRGGAVVIHDAPGGPRSILRGIN